MICRDIIAAVAEHYGLSVGDITGPRRQRYLVRPRFVAIGLCRALVDPPPSSQRLGQVFGRDHSSILHALDVVCRWEKPLTNEDAKAYSDFLRQRRPRRPAKHAPTEWR